MFNLVVFEILIVLGLVFLPCLVLIIVAGILIVVVMLTRKTVKTDQPTELG